MLRVRVTRLAVIFIPTIMGGFALILLLVGSLATGATRHHVYTGFRSRLGGRIATGFVSLKKQKIMFFFLSIVHISCLHFFINLVNCNDKFGSTMYWILYFKISLY